MRAEALAAVAGPIRTLVTCIEECTSDTADAFQARLEALLTEIDECVRATFPQQEHSVVLLDGYVAVSRAWSRCIALLESVHMDVVELTSRGAHSL